MWRKRRELPRITDAKLAAYPTFYSGQVPKMPECNFNDSRIDEGISLFNAGEFFACHDVWEDFWGELTCSEKPFFQGLIQAAVALFHFEEGNLGGARRMASSCGMYLSPFAPSCGRIDVARLLTDLDACFQELLEEHASYPFHLKIDPNKVPKIFRSSQTNSRGG